MRKQYDYYESRWPYYTIVLYHDGVKVGTERKSLHELDDYLEELESEGYTLGYTEEDVETARKEYENKRTNRIGPDVEAYDGEWIEERYIDEKRSDFKCSVCEFDDTFYRNSMHRFYKYCPNCGAKMKGAK